MRKENTASWIEKSCHVCGKIFINRPEWAYRRCQNGREVLFCSYHCMRSWEKRRHKTKVEIRDEIIQGIKDGLTNAEIIKKTSADASRVYYWRQKIEREDKKNERETEPEESIEVYCGP